MTYIIRDASGSYCAKCQSILGIEEDDWDSCGACGGAGFADDDDDFDQFSALVPEDSQ
jgi:hypothetical protein